MTREEILEALNLLPCSNPCFEGEKTWKTGHCIEKQKCEYINGMCHFINEIYPCYKIVKCLDVDKKDRPQPEALLKNETGQYIAIEMKCIPDPQFLESSVKETNKKNSYNCSFWKNTIDDSACKAIEKFMQLIIARLPNISQTDMINIYNVFFFGMNVNIIPIGNNLSVQELVYQDRKDFKPFLVDEMTKFSFNIFTKGAKIEEKDLCKTVIFNNKLKLSFIKTVNETIYFQYYDTTPFSLREHLRINEEGVTDFLKQFINSSENKFRELNKETSTEKNILLLTHESTLNKSSEVIAKCLNKLVVPKSIHEIWVTDHLYESIYNKDGEEIGEILTNYRYCKIYSN